MEKQDLKEQVLAKKNKSGKISFAALLFALSIVLSYLESLLPPLGPFPIRYGLANTPLMLALMSTGLPLALLLTILKALFALLTRGSIAALLSISGGLLSVTLMYLGNRFSRGEISYFLLSALGAVSHTSGQIIILIILWGSESKLFYLGILPYLLLISLASGFITALLTYLIAQNLPQKRPAEKSAGL